MVLFRVRCHAAAIAYVAVLVQLIWSILVQFLAYADKYILTACGIGDVIVDNRYQKRRQHCCYDIPTSDIPAFYKCSFNKARTGPN